jgi:hypothetical protein
MAIRPFYWKNIHWTTAIIRHGCAFYVEKQWRLCEERELTLAVGF